MNVYEWCHANSADLPYFDRTVLLHHAFHATAFPDRTERDAITLAETDPHTNGRLINTGYLAIDERAHALWFPAYEAAQG